MDTPTHHGECDNPMRASNLPLVPNEGGILPSIITRSPVREKGAIQAHEGRSVQVVEGTLKGGAVSRMEGGKREDGSCR